MAELDPALALVAASVWLDGERAFDGVADVAALSSAEATELAAEVLAALAIVSPTYAHSDSAAWEAALHQGARAHENIHDAIWLGQCVDTSAGFSVVYTTPRPDRYFGLPIGELTDGHHMAFAAARRVVEELRPKHDHQ